MPASNAFRYLSNLPGAQPIKSYREQQNIQSPQQEVQRFENQRLGGLMSGTSAQVGRQGTNIPQPNPRSTQLSVQAVTRGTSNSVRDSSKRMLQNAMVQRQRRIAKAAAEAERQRQMRLQGGSQGQWVQGRGTGTGYQGGGYQGDGRGASNSGGYVVGASGRRIQGMLGRFPGLRITETLGDRGYDQAHGVARSPGSYHYDRGNPAIDIAGPNNQLWALYYELKRVGGWRQILWQVAGHYDHIHVA